MRDALRSQCAQALPQVIHGDFVRMANADGAAVFFGALDQQFELAVHKLFGLFVVEKHVPGHGRNAVRRCDITGHG